MLKRVKSNCGKIKVSANHLKANKGKQAKYTTIETGISKCFSLPRLCLTEIRLKNTLLFPLNGSFMIHSSLAVSLSKCSFDCTSRRPGCSASCGRVSVMVMLSCLKCPRLFSWKKKLEGGLREQYAKKKKSHLHISCPFVFLKSGVKADVFLFFILVETGLLSFSVAVDIGWEWHSLTILWLYLPSLPLWSCSSFISILCLWTHLWTETTFLSFWWVSRGVLGWGSEQMANDNQS